ncbi:DUF4124 domain-containing protein [Marinobacter bryozoorum]|uniref:DUF4124 domain-containing protein n=1 Tax=Marinobacter bryozoorum TaxID=256324 RepID=UPI0020052FC6|nr:DUF4124 domain-containing protein [Marinobacter bryozoorum]MCK7542978.1 DUF4124 domain-containing protein [Marinobacter bryozoorum]
MRKLLFSLALLAPVAAQATVYQCEVDGQMVFADRPCGDDAKEITVDPVTVGGQLDTGTRTAYPKSRSRTVSRPRAERDCPFINSTDMRRLTIQGKLARGMKPGDVRHSWGGPSVINTGKMIQWVYYHDNGDSSYVYFRNGCVTSWDGRYIQK